MRTDTPLLVAALCRSADVSLAGRSLHAWRSSPIRVSRS